MRPTELKYKLSVRCRTRKINFTVYSNGKRGFKYILDDIMAKTGENKLNIQIISQKREIDANDLELVKE